MLKTIKKCAISRGKKTKKVHFGIEVSFFGLFTTCNRAFFDGFQHFRHCNIFSTSRIRNASVIAFIWPACDCPSCAGPMKAMTLAFRILGGLKNVQCLLENRRFGSLKG